MGYMTTGRGSARVPTLDVMYYSRMMLVWLGMTCTPVNDIIKSHQTQYTQKGGGLNYFSERGVSFSLYERNVVLPLGVLL